MPRDISLFRASLRAFRSVVIAQVFVPAVSLDDRSEDSQIHVLAFFGLHSQHGTTQEFQPLIGFLRLLESNGSKAETFTAVSFHPFAYADDAFLVQIFRCEFRRETDGRKCRKDAFQVFLLLDSQAIKGLEVFFVECVYDGTRQPFRRVRPLTVFSATCLQQDGKRARQYLSLHQD